MIKKRGLGRGLDALIGAARANSAGGTPLAGELHQLPVDMIQRGRYQPRRDFDQVALEELASSIRAQGLMQPIVVRQINGDRYEIVAGERRWRAAQMAGLSEIPVLIRDVTDQAAIAMALIENIQREDLNAIEEAGALQRLQQEFGLTHEQIAGAVGKSRTTVTNIMRLLGLTAAVRSLMESRKLEMGHGRALLTLTENQQITAAQQVIAQGLSVRQTEVLVRRLQSSKKTPKTIPAAKGDIQSLERELSERTGASISITHKADGKGRLVIRYGSLDELDGILRFFRN